MTHSKKASWNVILTIGSMIFAAGTAWGISKVNIDENKSRILKVENSLEEHIAFAESQITAVQLRLEAQMESLREEQVAQRVILERVATDIEWMKNRQESIK